MSNRLMQLQSSLQYIEEAIEKVFLAAHCVTALDGKLEEVDNYDAILTALEDKRAALLHEIGMIKSGELIA